MTILLTLWRLITGNPIARAIGGAVAALAALWAYGLAKKREGASTARADAAAKAAKVERKGAEAARQGRAEAADALRNGKTPEEIRRQNDGKW